MKSKTRAYLMILLVIIFICLLVPRREGFLQPKKIPPVLLNDDCDNYKNPDTLDSTIPEKCKRQFQSTLIDAEEKKRLANERHIQAQQEWLEQHNTYEASIEEENQLLNFMADAHNQSLSDSAQKVLDLEKQNVEREQAYALEVARANAQYLKSVDDNKKKQLERDNQWRRETEKQEERDAALALHQDRQQLAHDERGRALDKRRQSTEGKWVRQKQDKAMYESTGDMKSWFSKIQDILKENAKVQNDAYMANNPDAPQELKDKRNKWIGEEASRIAAVFEYVNTFGNRVQFLMYSFYANSMNAMGLRVIKCSNHDNAEFLTKEDYNKTEVECKKNGHPLPDKEYIGPHFPDKMFEDDCPVNTYGKTPSCSPCPSGTITLEKIKSRDKAFPDSLLPFIEPGFRNTDIYINTNGARDKSFCKNKNNFVDLREGGLYRSN
jgi:hypothetical protein